MEAHMARHAVWPPRRKIHASGQEYVRFKGRNYYLGAPGTPAADEKYRQLLIQLNPSRVIGIPAPIPVHQLTVADVVARWVVEERPRYPATSQEPREFGYSVEPLIRLWGNLPAANLDANALEAVQLDTATRCNRNVVNRRIVRIRTIWRWAERKKLVPAGSYSHLLTLRGLSLHDARLTIHPRPRIRLSESQIFTIADRAPAVVGDMLRLQYLTGMRSSEVRTMRIGDMDRVEWIYRPGTHKMAHRGQTRVVPLGPECRTILEKYLDRPSDQFIFRPSRKRRPGNVCYTSCTYSQAAARAAKLIGIDGFRPYSLRHAAKQRLTRLYGLDVARAVLGQKSLGTTNQYGDALDLEAATRAMRESG